MFNNDENKNKKTTENNNFKIEYWVIFLIYSFFLEKFFCIRNNPKPVNKFNKTMVLNKIKKMELGKLLL